MRKRWISMLLVLCMVFTMFPSAAFAEEASVAIGTTSVTDSGTSPVCDCVVKCTLAPECVCPPVDSGEPIHGEDCPLSDPETAVAQINPDCPACAAAGVDLAICKGAAALMMSAAPRAIGDIFQANITIGGIAYSAKFKELTSTTVQIGPGGTGGNQYALGQADRNADGNLEIPQTVSSGGKSYTVTAIGEGAFDSAKITGLSMPTSIVTIGQKAFYTCQQLTSLTIPTSVQTIEESAFAFCDSIRNFTIPASVKTIGNSAFKSCKALTDITIPATVQSIGNDAFNYCDGLKKVTLPQAAPTVGTVAFPTSTMLYRPASATGYDAGNWLGYKDQFIVLLTFTDEDWFNIPATTVGTPIIGINVYNAVKGGVPPYKFLSSGLPTGISINNNGYISGTPTVACTAGTATIKVSDSHSTVPQNASISIAYGAVTKPLPTISGTVTISGTPKFGQVLTANAELTAGGDGTLSYQWQRNNANISGATGKTYTTVAADVGQTLNYNVKSTTAQGALTADGVKIERADGPAAPALPAINFTAETVATLATWEYKSGSDWKSCSANMSSADLGWDGTTELKVQFRVAESATNLPSAESAPLNIPARPAAPAANLFTVTPPSGKDINDGTLDGITNLMEYKKAGEGSYTTGSGKLTGIAGGTTYQIRTKATADQFASDVASILVPNKSPAVITFADKTVLYNGSVQLHETATTSESGGTMTYTYAAVTGSSLNAQGKPQDAGSYTVTATYESSTHAGSATVNFTITAAPLTVTSYTVTDKTYDGTDTATISAVTFSGLQNGETLSSGDYTVTDAKFAQKNAADGAIAVTGKIILASSVKNYSLASGTLSGQTSKINKAVLTGGAIDANQSKPYDATNSFTGINATYAGGVNGETVTGKVSGTVTGVNASASQVLAVTGQTLDLAFATNYTLPANNAVTGNVAIIKINPEIRIDAPSTGIAGKDVTVTVKITKPTGAAAGFPAAGEIILAANGNATAMGSLVQTGTTGVYTQKFTIAGDAAMDTEITFTATVPTATANYNADATGASAVLTVSDKLGSQTVLSADKASITYGESVILTATVTKATAGDPGTLAGTVQFKVGSDNLGTAQPLTNGKATLTVDKATLQAASGGKTYSFTAEFTATGDYAGSTSSPATVTVAQKPLTITPKDEYTYQYRAWADVPVPKLAYAGFVDGETEAVLTGEGYQAKYSVTNTQKYGKEAIAVIGSTTNQNYAVTTQNGTLTIQEWLETPKAPEPNLPPSVTIPVVVGEPVDATKELRVLAAELIQSEVEQTSTKLIEQGVSEDADAAFYEVELQVSNDNGGTWQKATMQDVKDGKVKVALPIPAGTSSSTHSYMIYHFANGADKAAEKLTPDVNDASKLVSATVTSLSPFVVVATPKGGGNNTSTGGGSGGSSHDDDEYDFWMTVKKNIQKADSGDVVKVSARKYDKMPASVMETLRKNSEISLVITWSGKTITIPAGMAQKNKPGRIYWPLSKLAELYADVDATTVLVPIRSNNPETGGLGKYIPVTGGADWCVPVTGGSTLVVETPEIQHDPAIPTTIREQAITPPDAGFEADAFAGTPDATAAGTPDATAAGTVNAVAFAGFAMLLAALCGGGVWFWKRKL